MGAGRPPKPIKLVDGAFSKEVLQQREEAEEKLKSNNDKILDPPSYLSKEEKKHYNRIMEEIKDLDIICNTDVDVLAMICICIATIEDCNKRIKKEGRIISSFNSYGKQVTIENPACKLQLKYMQMLKQYIQEMPIFSPSARAKLSLMATQKQEEDNDPLLRILNGKDI